MTAIEPTMTREEARERTTTIRGKLSDALEELVSAYFDGVHIALGYDDWDTYVHEEFGEVRFKLAAADRSERVRELRGQGMPVKVVADLFGVTERTVKRDTTEGTNVPTPAEVEASIAAAAAGLKAARDSITEGLTLHPEIRLPTEIVPPSSDDVVAELIAVATARNLVLRASLIRVEALKAKADTQVRAALRADADLLGDLSERMKSVHYAAGFLGRSDEVEEVASGLGLHWSDEDGHYIDANMDDAE